MRTCSAGRTVFKSSYSCPRRTLPQLTHASLRLTESLQNRRSSPRTTSPAALSAPESVLVERVSLSASSSEAALALLERAVSVTDAERPSASPASKRETLESPEELASTSGHRAIVGSAILLLAAIGSQGVAGIHSSFEAAGVLLAVSAAYILAGTHNPWLQMQSCRCCQLATANIPRL